MTDFHLPTDGSVLLVDDKIDEVIPLIKLFSREGIATTFYEGNNPDELPEKPCQKVRLAFCDIQLIPNQDQEFYARKLAGLLEQLITEDNGPYVLVLCSSRLQPYSEHVKQYLMSNNNNRQPLEIIELDKTDFFTNEIEQHDFDEKIKNLKRELSISMQPDDIDDAVQQIELLFPPNKTWVKRYEDTLTRIFTTLQKKLKEKVDGFQFFTLWETQIKKASGANVKNYSELHTNKMHWSENIKYIIFRMAYAQAGKSLDQLDDLGFMENAIKTMNLTFLDDVDAGISRIEQFSPNISIDRDSIFFTISFKKKTYKLKFQATSSKYFFYKNDICIPTNTHGFGSLEALGKKVLKASKSNPKAEDYKAFLKIIKQYEDVRPQLNTKLHIDNSPVVYLKPGNLYEFGELVPERHKELLKNYFKCGNSDSDLFKNGRWQKQISSLRKIKFVELEVSPPCDYAQNKWLKSRVLPGIMYPEEFFKFNTIARESNFAIPPIRYKGQNYQLLFDFRLFKSTDREHMLSLGDPLFRLRQEIHSDIISKLSNHVNRLGYANFE